MHKYRNLKLNTIICLTLMHSQLLYVTGFGKMCIVHTSNFSHSRTYKIWLKQYTDMKFSEVIEKWQL